MWGHWPTGWESHDAGNRHDLEADFDLTAREILEIISGRMRLAVAVRGGVAEHHLEKRLQADPDVSAVERLDADGLPDFRVVLITGQAVLVECKNVSPTIYANGDYKVEVQKTRASKGDPAEPGCTGPSSSDIVAACLYSATREWTFRYEPHELASSQR